MPNGGSDCCGTCWFNKKNKGDVGYEHAKNPGNDYCIIRNTKIEDPFWTYCTNHPHHNPNKIREPIGPIYVFEDSNFNRKIWLESPDTKDIRKKLLELVEKIKEQPKEEYPSGMYLDEMVVWQLKEFKEDRSLPELKRIASFNPKATTGDPFHRTREHLVYLAIEAIAKLKGYLHNGGEYKV